MEQRGRVKSVRNGKAEIEVARISSCGGGCKTCASSCNTPGHTVILDNKLGAKIGDMVELKGETKNILKYTLIVYMIPFASLLIGIMLGMKLLSARGVKEYELLGFLIGIGFMSLGYLIVKLLDNRIGQRDESTIEIVRIID